MSVESEVLSVLENSSEVSAILTDSPMPVWSGPAQDNSTTYISFSVIGTYPANEINGTPGLDRSRVQIDCFANTGNGVVNLASAVRTAMSNAAVAWTLKNYLLNRIGPYEDRTELYRVTQDFSVWHNPT